jgi:hypothetical protein
MATLLSLPKRPWLRFVWMSLYFFFLYCVFDCCWNRVIHGHWQVQWGKDIYFALGISLFLMATNTDYYAWRNKLQPQYSINPDRDEATTSRKPIDNRSQEI